MIKLNNIHLSYKIENGSIRTLKEYVVAFFKGRLKYTKLEVLKGVDIHVRKGEVLGIVGENGAGKSTLLKIISGIIKPSMGDVSVNGKVVPMLELGCGFDTELTGKENIFLNGAILGYSKKYLEEKYDDILNFSELENFINEPIRTYSSGMMMRLGFSIAVMCEPEVLIVDEILAVGDDKFQIKSQNKMMELMKGGTTVIMVSHNIEVIKSLCDRVIWLEQGKIKMDGAPCEVCDAYTNR